MRIVRSTAAASLALLATALAAPNVAQAGEQPEPVAVARAKVQLVAGLASASDRDANQAGAVDLRYAGQTDHILGRVDAAFGVLTSGDTLDAARLPRSRPGSSRELVALAYAEEPAKAAPRRSAGKAAIEDLVAKHAESQDVPPALAQALVQVESSFNPKATGRNGEIGLFQIKPQTARAMGYTGSAKGLYDAETNVAVGMKYLAQAHDRAGGDTCGTLLRFNAGLDAKRASKGSNRFCAKVKKAMAKRA
jgi:soluble lytic murein transglycosylase-like protein